ncbi:magnesium-dependent phosphatase 1 isoform X1 [Exaiptasia diaphana]|uniref:Magnesium-dependent phosphatase 1 n=1 Tax=Exaiptasia diaphana TaxID=2652724 RepID=A0A913WRJ1_EXADI|nr:magnesium-dependent phosphatase 1 isoform X1 [Exaiptasia diaphana]KXJ18510.1 Magnesium-dependent phosphatase 1 [Exaiptasia diaphana]
MNLEYTRILPKLIVFDLDYTLWPLWVDTHVKLPIKKTKDGTVVDTFGYEINLISILKWLERKDVKLAVASRTTEPAVAYELIKIFEIEDFFHYKEIYPGCKVKHFKKFAESSNIPFKEMLFFDDEERNIWDINQLGVTCLHVPDGISMASFQDGLEIYSDKFDNK